MLYYLLFFLSLLSITSAADTAIFKTDSVSLKKELDKLVSPIIENDLASNLVIGIYKDGKKIILKYGYMDQSGQRMPNENTVYEIGSISKVFTGVLLADSILNKKITLNDTVQEHLPKGVEIPQFKDNPILMKHLISHSSGLPRLPTNFAPKDSNNPYADYNSKLLYEGLAEIKLNRNPEDKYVYSNLAVGLLGELLAQVNTSKNYSDLLQQRILKPLKLKDTGTELSDHMRDNLAIPYSIRGEKAPKWKFQALVGAGGVNSTVNDLLNFAIFNIKLDPIQAPIIQALKVSQNTIYKYNKTEVAMAWHKSNAGTTLWHNGATGGYRSYLSINKKDNTAIVILASSTSSKITTLGQKIERLLLGKKVTPLTVRSEKKIAKDILQKYVGEYQINPLATITVTLKNERLFAQYSNQAKYPLFGVNDRHFFYRVVAAEIKFVQNPEGKVTGLVLIQNGIHPAKKMK